MPRKDFFTGLIFVMFAGAILVMIVRSPTVADASGAGPFFFPAIAALLIGGLSLALLIKGAKEMKNLSPATTEKVMWGRNLWIILWCLIYGFTIERLGYLLSTGLVTFALLAFFCRGKWLFNTVFTVATPLSIYLLFNFLLKVPLPKGLLGF